MARRFRLQENMESLARRKQLDYERTESWKEKNRYYQHWEKHNNRYDNWTSDKYYETSVSQYDAEMKKREKEERLKVRRDKLRKLLHEEELEFDMEITESPRERKCIRRPRDTPTEVLKDINLGLKLAEEDRRRHEAELKLYHQWRNENPIIRDYISNQNHASLKLAWLDQQIEKRMAQEKCEEETRRMIAEKEKLIKEQEELERKETAEKARREKELLTKIEEQMEEYKRNENRSKFLEEVEERTRKKKMELEEIEEQRTRELEKRKQKDLLLFNINQSKMKLRKKAMEVEEQLHKEQLLIEDIEKLKISESLESEEQKEVTRNAVNAYLKYVRDQQKLEQQRQQYISFIFDSEAKGMWQKQEQIWRQEQETRDKLLNDVLAGLKQQIQEKIERTSEERKRVQMETDLTLKEFEETDKQIRQERDELERKKIGRRMELEKQMNDKKLREKEQEFLEQKKKKEELECIRKEEERLRNELMQLQRSKYHPARFNRKNMFW